MELKILWTLPYLPWPTTSGGKLRQYHLLKGLAARGHKITLLVLSKTELDIEIEKHLMTFLDRLIVIRRRPLRHPLTLLKAIFATQPLLASVNGFSQKLSSSFETLLERSWDIVQIEHSYGIQPFLAELKRCHTPFIMTEHNVESSLAAATYQHLPKYFIPFIYYDQWRYVHWEKKIMHLPARLIAVTDADALRLASIRGTSVDVVINGVDSRFFSQVVPDYQSHRILFIGNYEYPPNLNAVEWAINEIMPVVWKAHPQAHFVICGYAMPASWPEQYVDPRLEFKGFVDDLTQVQAECSIFLAALREGGGSKLKVMEAMAAGLALVSTLQGVSGLAISHGENCLLADHATGLAEAIISLMQHPDHAEKMGMEGRDYVHQHHDWSIAVNQLEGIYKELIDARRH